MIIIKKIENFIVNLNNPIEVALKKLELNQKKILFLVSDSYRIIGSISDGDIRRWLQSSNNIDKKQPVKNIAHYECFSLSDDTNHNLIKRSFTAKISVIPLIDESHQLTSIACDETNRFFIENKEISDSSDTFIIAEIGNNHNGSFETAKNLVDAAINVGADCAKFQMRSMSHLYGDPNYEGFDLGSQYIFDLLSKFQLTDDNLYRIFDYCHSKNIIPMCTPFDMQSLHNLESYGIQAYKVASADFTNHDFLKEISKLQKPMICSTGMTNEIEIVESINKLTEWSAQFMLLHCNSTYPSPFKDINLNYMSHLKTLSNTIVGYSGHERGFAVPIAAVSMGAKIIEKHFTLNKSMEGNDHRVSLLPEEFKEMVKGIRQVEDAIGNDLARKVSQGEMMNRENLAKSLVASADIEANSIIGENTIEIKSPGNGIQPNKKNEILGLKIYTSKKKGEPFFMSDFNQNEPVENLKFNFPFKWGIPVRYHDIRELSAIANIDLVEIHLSNSDLDTDYRRYLNSKSQKGLVVHAPELFADDKTLDLCSDNDEYRIKSVQNLQKVINLTKQLNEFFTNENDPLIVTNVGGFSNEIIESKVEINNRYKALKKSLKQLDSKGVEILPQTMPPFPWHNGGQQCHNLFVDSNSIIKFCKDTGMRICLDISHSKLACNLNKWDFSDFIKKISPYVAHMHISDSKGVDGEGLQIGDGDIDWIQFWNDANSFFNKDTTFIPEVWQGHKNKGKAMWDGLKTLEGFLNSK